MLSYIHYNIRIKHGIHPLQHGYYGIHRIYTVSLLVEYFHDVLSLFESYDYQFENVQYLFSTYVVYLETSIILLFKIL